MQHNSPRELPTLDPVPRHLPDCCLSLSNVLLATLATVLSRHADQQDFVLLSIGSGSGLFEACLKEYLDKHDMSHVSVEGVEVDATINTYLSSNCLHTVSGTWAVCERARQVDALMFVYPREPLLVSQYLETCAARLQMVLWLGPKSDWTEYKPLLQGSPSFGSPTVLSTIDSLPYEIAVLLEKA